jgi:sterol desaturase/sphingolipid hydroxylase (fatty acid hydroxylase superfamily)
MDSLDATSFRAAYLVIGAVAISAALIEATVLAFVVKRGYNWKSYFASLFIGAGRRIGDLVPLAIALPGAFWLYEHRLIDWNFRDWPAYVVLFFALEFAYYWFHRASHRVRLWWLNHSVHHSPNEFTLSTAYRLGWTGRLTLMLIFFVPLAALGFPPVMIVIALSINLLYQFWIHAEWIPKLGSLEGILNTPSAHRVHHASNIEYLDANYGCVLMIFDRMFGTYIPERDDIKPVYGWVQPMQSHNPLAILFRPWADLWRDLKTARSIRDVIGFIFAPPGWQPDGNGPTTENLRKRARTGNEAVAPAE